MTESSAHVQVTEYQVTCLPEGHELSSSMTITVAYRGNGRWAVLRNHMCLGADGTWEYEMRPSERDDEWLETHRFGRVEALALAKDAAPLLTCMGHTVASVLARGEGE